MANIHFETNASACDMGIQIIFDAEGITEGWFKAPDGRRIYSFQSAGGMKAIGGQTEGFLEGVEPQITELLEALGCEPSDEEEEISLEELFEAFPAGDYKFKGTRKGARFEDQATLTHLIPAGPEIVRPADGTVVPDAALLIDWDPVTEAILPGLGPVEIVGYHVIVVEAGGEALPQLDIDLPASETRVRFRRSTSSRTRCTSSRSWRQRRVATRPSRRAFSVLLGSLIVRSPDRRRDRVKASPEALTALPHAPCSAEPGASRFLSADGWRVRMQAQLRDGEPDARRLSPSASR